MTRLQRYSLSGDFSGWSALTNCSGAAITYAQYIAEGGAPVRSPPSHVFKVTTDGNNGAAVGHTILKNYGSAATFNMGMVKSLTIRVYLPPAQRTKFLGTGSGIQPQLRVDSGNRRTFSARSTVNGNLDVGLNTLNIEPNTTSEFSDFGSDTGTYTAATAIEFRTVINTTALNNVPASPAIFYIVDVCANWNDIPRIVVTWDDGAVSQYTDMFPLAQTYGIPGTLFIIASGIPSEGAGSAYLQPSQIAEMYNSGLFDIGMHGCVGALNQYTDTTEAGVIAEIQAQKAAFVAKGLPISRSNEILAWPQGAWAAGTTDGKDIMAIVRGLGYKMMRGSASGGENIQGELNTGFVRSYSFGSLAKFIENLTDFQNALAVCKATGQDLIIRAHKVENPVVETNSLTTANLTAIFTELQKEARAGTVRLMTFGEYYDAYSSVNAGSAPSGMLSSMVRSIIK
jgi:hypothetical protein